MTLRDVGFMGVGALLLAVALVLAVEVATWKINWRLYKRDRAWEERQHGTHWHRIPQWHWEWARRAHYRWLEWRCDRPTS